MIHETKQALEVLVALEARKCDLENAIRTIRELYGISGGTARISAKTDAITAAIASATASAVADETRHRRRSPVSRAPASTKSTKVANAWVPPPEMIPWAHEMRKRLATLPKTSPAKREIYHEVFKKTSENGVVYPGRVAEILAVPRCAVTTIWKRHLQKGWK